MNSNPLIRRSQPMVVTDNPALRFNLLENPFPDAASIAAESTDPRSNGTIYVEKLRRDEQYQFENLLIPRTNGLETRRIVMLMDYATRRGRGIGKTAFLKHQCQRIMQDLGDELTGGAYVLCATHVFPESGGKTRYFWQFVRQIALSLTPCIAWALWRLRAQSERIPEAVLAQVDLSSPGETLGQDGWLQKQGVEVVMDLNLTVQQQLRQQNIGDDRIQPFLLYAHDPSAWRRWLEGQSEYWWRREGIRFVFDDLAKLLHTAGISRTLLLVDQVEYIVPPQRSQERRAFTEDLRRHFIDGPFYSVSARSYDLLLTIHPEIQELWTPHWQAVGLDRICPMSGNLAQEYTIYFHPIKSEEAAEQLVLAYLDYFRSPVEKRGSLHPFDKDAIAMALQIKGGVPGQMLQLLHLVFEKAIKEDWSTITAAQVRAFHDSEQPSEPEVEAMEERLSPARIDLREE